MAALLIREVFVDKAREIHGLKYDYSLVDYYRSNRKIKIVCPEHGPFTQVPNSHLNGRGCPICGRIKSNMGKMKLNFVERAIQKHGNRYDYSSTVYKGCDTKVDVICRMHGMFRQDPYTHLTGHGCPRCARESEKYNQLSTDSFIAKAKKLHGDKYDYSLVDYSRSSIKVKIVCPKHGVFEQTPNNHLMGMECIRCANEANGERRRSNTQEFITRARKVHGSKYDYSQTEYIDTNKKITIICSIHGGFLQVPPAHLSGRGCPLCQESRGERKIGLFFKAHQIDYERQKTFDQCRNVRPLFFDFYVPALNMCVEYDGKQHFQPVEFFGGQKAFDQLRKLDGLKDKFCSENGVKLIRIPYNKRIEPALKSAFQGLLPVE